MNINIVKMVVDVVASGSVGLVIDNAIKATTPDNLNKIKKVGITVGSFILGSFVTDKVGEYVSEKFDECVDAFKKLTSNNNEETILIEEETKDEE